jgi:hypothetical protein
MKDADVRATLSMMRAHSEHVDERRFDRKSREIA